MQIKLAQAFEHVVQFIVGLSAVCAIGWLLDRSSLSGWAIFLVDAIVIGIVIEAVLVAPRAYRAYVGRERKSKNG
jgi:F0F1-type ATP synthase assembly protein I